MVTPHRRHTFNGRRQSWTSSLTYWAFAWWDAPSCSHLIVQGSYAALACSLSLGLCVVLGGGGKIRGLQRKRKQTKPSLGLCLFSLLSVPSSSLTSSFRAPTPHLPPRVAMVKKLQDSGGVKQTRGLFLSTWSHMCKSPTCAKVLEVIR